MADLLATKRGRLTAFFLLYLTEGIPQGFAMVAVATQMRREGLGPAEIATFTASLYLPWAWKFLAGPVVDLVSSDRLGRRRMWIVGCQLVMAATIILASAVNFATALSMFIAIVLVHNVFAATQDVAIDALAVDTLPESERGFANGLMFAGAYTGSAIGGGGVLALSTFTGFQPAFWLVAGAILVVTATVSLRVKERRRVTDADTVYPPGVMTQPGFPAHAASATPPHPTGSPRPTAYYDESLPVAEPVLPKASTPAYPMLVLRSMFASGRSIAGLAFALLPTGAYAINQGVATNLGVELGLGNDRIAIVTVVATILSAAGCVTGGYLSDRFGRRRMMTLYILLTLAPTLVLASVLLSAGWIMPIDVKSPTAPKAGAALVATFIALACSFAFLQGLIWGSRTAGYMDLCDSRVAATQFSAYTSLMNLTLSYSSFWVGRSIVTWGYPTTLFIDACVGVVCLVPLMFMTRKSTA